MSKKFYQTPEFQKLQAKWYGKLSKEGHEDIEVIDPQTGDPYPLLHSKRGCYNSAVDVIRKHTPAGERYFELARAHYWDMVGTEEECEIFRLYAQRGFSVSRISKIMGVSSKNVKALIQNQEALFLPTRTPA